MVPNPGEHQFMSILGPSREQSTAMVNRSPCAGPIGIVLLALVPAGVLYTCSLEHRLGSQQVDNCGFN